MTTIHALNSHQSPPIFVLPPPIINEYKAPIGGGACSGTPKPERHGLLYLLTAFFQNLGRAVRGSGVSTSRRPPPIRTADLSRSKAPVIRAAASASTGRVFPLPRSVWFNRALLSDQLLPVVDHIFHRRLPNGSYWYDYVSGEWGVAGRGRSCKIRPGLELGGPLMPDASKGKTGIFVNGREIT